MALDLKNRAVGAKNRILTIIGIVAGVLVEVGGMAGMFPQDSRLHAVAVALGVLGTALRMPGKAPPAAVFALLVGASLLAAPAARAQEGQPGGILPEAGGCFFGGRACLQPALAAIPISIDVRSGKLERNIAFGFGYGLIFARLLNDRFRPGVDFLGGVHTGGNWNASIMARLGVLRAGPILTHRDGLNYLSIGFGAGH